MDINNSVIDNQVVCSDEDNEKDCHIYFEANISLNAFSYYKLSRVKNIHKKERKLLEFEENDTWKTYACDNTRGLKIHKNKKDFIYMSGDEQYPFNISYRYYQAESIDKEQRGGVYIFRPNSKTGEGSISYSNPQRISVAEGTILTEITVIYIV